MRTRSIRRQWAERLLFCLPDALITWPWSHVREADFLGLIDEIRAADVAIVNLETVIHEFKGHAQADSGGTYMAYPQRAKQWTTFADLGLAAALTGLLAKS